MASNSASETDGDKQGGKKLNKNDLQNLVSLNSERLTYEEGKVSRGSASDIWKKYYLILVDGKLVDYVKCLTCNSAFSYKSSQGNSALNRHTCGDSRSNKSGTTKPSPSAGTAGNQVKIRSFMVPVVPKASLDALNKDLTIGFAKDLRPLHAIQGAGFRYSAQALINFGAVHGAQDVDKVLKHR